METGSGGQFLSGDARASLLERASSGMADFSTPLPQAGAADTSTPDTWKGKLQAGFGRVRALSISFFNPLEFSRPASQADWIARVSGNASHFSPVYACFFAPVVLYTMMSSWWLCLGSLLVCALWGYAYILKASDAEIFRIPFSKFITCSVISVLCMLMTGMINALFYAIFLFSFVGFPHMSLHNLPGAVDALDVAELQPMQH